MPTPVEAHTPYSPRKRSSTPSTTPLLLHDWWLVKADSGRLGVKGFNYSRCQATRCFSSAPIVKRRDAVTLETVDGITVLLRGHLNRSHTLQNGFSEEACDDFRIGFPYYWEEFAATSVSEEPSLFSVPKGTYSSDAYKTPDTGDHRNIFVNAMQTDEDEVSDAYRTPDPGDCMNVSDNSMLTNANDASVADNILQTDEDEVSDAYKTPDPRDYMNVSDNAMQTNDDDASVSDNILQTNTNDSFLNSGASSAGKSSQPRENMVTTPDKTPLSSKKVKPKQKKTSGNYVEDVVRGGPLTRSRTRMLKRSVRTASTCSSTA